MSADRRQCWHPTWFYTDAMVEYGAPDCRVSVEFLGFAFLSPDRIAGSGDVVNFVPFLNPDEASYLTGSEYTIDASSSTLLSIG